MWCSGVMDNYVLPFSRLTDRPVGKGNQWLAQYEGCSIAPGSGAKLYFCKSDDFYSFSRASPLGSNASFSFPIQSVYNESPDDCAINIGFVC